MTNIQFASAGFALVLTATLIGRPAHAQKGSVVTVNAEAFAREFAADETKAEAKYRGKSLRLTGVVGAIYDDILYIPCPKTGGGTIDIGIRYGKGNKPPVETGKQATFEGKFDRVGALGPVITDCKLIADKQAAPPKLEFRRAETKPAEGLIEATVSGRDEKIYLHPKAAVTESDIAEATTEIDEKTSKVVINIVFNEAGAKKVAKLTEEWLGKPLAILVDGKVISAPVIRAQIRDKAQITGKFTEDEAKALAKAIRPR